MSKIADKIRAYVNDPDVADHYGEWGILRRDQRLLIRKLCDTCDMFERAADELWRKQVWISVEDRLPEKLTHVIVHDEDGTIGEAFYLSGDCFEWVANEKMAFVTHWMPLPEAPKGGVE